jgi:hypothetical protein
MDIVRIESQRRTEYAALLTLPPEVREARQDAYMSMGAALVAIMRNDAGSYEAAQDELDYLADLTKRLYSGRTGDDVDHAIKAAYCALRTLYQNGSVTISGRR